MREWLRKIQFVAMFALASAALLMLLLCWTPVLPLAYFAFGSLCLLLHGRKRLFVGVPCALALVALGVLLLPWRGRIWLLAAPIAYAVLLLYTLPIAGWTHETELPFTGCFAGCACFIAAQLAQMLKPDVYAPTATWMLLCFLGYGALWMLSLNRQSLIDASAHGKRAPQGVRRKNLLFTIGLMAVVMLISAIPALAEALSWAWDRLVEILKAIWRFLSSLLPEAEISGGSGAGGEMGMLGGEAVETALWVEILEKVLAALALVALAVGLYFGLRLLGRKLRVLLGKLWTLLGRYAQAASEDYVDEVADTRQTGENASMSRKNLFADWFRQVSEDKLTPVERIRYRYKRLRRRHEEWTDASTARENLSGDLATLYERARYAGQAMTAQEAETFAAQAKELEKKA